MIRIYRNLGSRCHVTLVRRRFLAQIQVIAMGAALRGNTITLAHVEST